MATCGSKEITNLHLLTPETMGLFQWGCCKERLFCAFTQIGEVVNDSSVFLIGILIIHYLRRGVIGKVLSCDALIAKPKWSGVRSLVQAFRLLTKRSAAYKRLTCSLQHKYQWKLQPVWRQAVRSHLAVILDTKEVEPPVSWDSSHSGAHITALATLV